MGIPETKIQVPDCPFCAQDWLQLKIVSAFTADIDFANLHWKPSDADAIGADIFVMSTGNSAFGWLRSYEKENAGGTLANVKGLETSSYTIIG